MHEESIEISWQNGKPVLNLAAKRWIIRQVINPYVFIPSDAPVLIRALLSDNWTPFASNAWRLCWVEWQEKASVFEVREHVSMIKDYTLAYTGAQH